MELTYTEWLKKALSQSQQRTPLRLPGQISRGGSPICVSQPAAVNLQPIATQVQLAIDKVIKRLSEPKLVFIECLRCSYLRVMDAPIRQTADVQYNLKFICPQCFKHDGVAMVMREQNK